VNIPAIEELRDRTERISGDGKLALPYVGAIQTEGMTEKDLKAALISRLQKYMYDPQVDLFVKQYRSRQVAVIGSVAKPGLYDLASGKDTILDMISQAGGMRDDSAQRVLLIAAEENTKQPASADGGPRRATDQPPVLPALITGDVNTVLRNANSTPIVIDTRNLVRGGSQTYMALPARPGDVIVVPSAGDVLVQGWVNKPGNYHITPGLTILGALAAAGGPMFAAKMRSVKLARSGRNGEKVLMTANINRIQKGQDSDIPLQEGDVVDVEYSPVKVVPYSVYYLVNKIGFGVPIIP
jgi:polysaccharide export outer membrane protein